MIELSRTRLTIAITAASTLGALLVLDRASHTCLLAGGRFEILRWTCVPLPPVIIERDLKRS